MEWRFKEEEGSRIRLTEVISMERIEATLKDRIANYLRGVPYAAVPYQELSAVFRVSYDRMLSTLRQLAIEGRVQNFKNKRGVVVWHTVR